MNEYSIAGFLKFIFLSDVTVIFIIIIIKPLSPAAEHCALIHLWLCFVSECIFPPRNLILALKYG